MAAPVTAALPVPVDPPPRDGVLRYLGFDGCVRLPITVDAAVLAAELDRLPADAWGQASRDPVVQASVESFFAMGYPRGPRPLPSADRPVLAHLPALRRVLRETIAASPTRAIVARLLPHGLIPIHTRHAALLSRHGPSLDPGRRRRRSAVVLRRPVVRHGSRRGVGDRQPEAARDPQLGVAAAHQRSRRLPAVERAGPPGRRRENTASASRTRRRSRRSKR